MLGVPIAITITAEAGLFNAVSILMGTRGAAIAAAHQVAINFAATMFMVPLAVHSALTIRVGHALGRGDPEQARRIGIIGIVICGGMMALSALGLLLFRADIAAFYTGDGEVLPLAVSLLTMAMIFQVSDGLQVGAAGALRGFKDTRVPMFINFGCYWLAAFPAAWYLGVERALGPQAVWVALIIGLSLIAVVYIGFVALVQQDMKKLIAYSSIAHMGFVTLGFFLMWSISAGTGAVLGISGGSHH